MSISSLQTSELEDYVSLGNEIRDIGRRKFRDGYETIVFTNGCFDIIHPGHIDVLMCARNHGGPRGALVVGINSDESVRSLKGDGRPVFDQEARAKVLACLRFVDHVVVFDEPTPKELIAGIRPSLIVKGGDYEGWDVVGSEVAPVFIGPYDGRWSTSKIIEKVRNG